MKTLLFSSYGLRGLQLPNRIVMAPMTRSRAIGNLPNELMARYYASRASAGLLITEGTSPSPDGLGYSRIPALYRKRHAQAWRLVTDQVHRQAGRIFVQLMHTGRVGHPLNLPADGRVLAPSPLAAPGEMWTDQLGPEPLPVPTIMTEADIRHVIDEHVQAAALAIEAGFDGVELHGANGYLLNQFMHPRSNTRNDAWGGNLHKRLRFIEALVREVVAAIGADRVGYRLSPFSDLNGMGPEEDLEAFVALTHRLGILDIAYVHFINPQAGAGQPPGLLTLLRANFGGAIIAAGGYGLATASAALASGDADLIAFGRPFIANPDLVTCLRYGLPLRDHDPATLYTPGAAGYVDEAGDAPAMANPTRFGKEVIHA